VGQKQGLGVRIYGNKIDAADTFIDHPVDSIAPTTTYSDYPNAGKVFYFWRSLHILTLFNS
jgi:hypothetical protein